MKTLVNKAMFDDFRTVNCKAASCEECEQGQTCLLNIFFDTAVGDGGDGTDIELAVRRLRTGAFTSRAVARKWRGIPTTAMWLTIAVSNRPGHCSFGLFRFLRLRFRGLWL
jgi:hypothetical protein